MEIIVITEFVEFFSRAASSSRAIVFETLVLIIAKKTEIFLEVSIKKCQSQLLNKKKIPN